uniref:Thymosin beta 1 n=1 Tax=Neolamprologus brichardi TaxID=32507 RepID=A0A3Q4HK43_NEOBR
MSDSNPVNQEVEQFNKQKLKKTNTQEKNHLPTKEGRSLRQKKCAPNKPLIYYFHISPLLWLTGCSVHLWRDMQQQKEENESVSKCPSFPSEAVKLPAV